jgi:hypothetical protein
VRTKHRAWLLIALVAAVCGLAVWGAAWYRSAAATPAALLKRMPYQDSLLVYVDFAALRKGGFLDSLQGGKMPQDPEYASFVRGTEFDYTQDLDAALVAFAPAGKYLFVRGRFDWRSLRTYVEREGGRCYNTFCRIEGSTPERRISFFPVQSGLMALAVAPDDSAALALTEKRPGPPPPQPPAAPVWMLVPSSLLKNADALPSGTRMFARGMENAESVMLSFAPEGARVAARLEVRCHNPQEAAAMVTQLRGATDLLRQLIARERQTPSPADLSGILTSGDFRAEGPLVIGRWAIEKPFLESVFGAS